MNTPQDSWRAVSFLRPAHTCAAGVAAAVQRPPPSRAGLGPRESGRSDDSFSSSLYINTFEAADTELAGERVQSGSVSNVLNALTASFV